MADRLSASVLLPLALLLSAAPSCSRAPEEATTPLRIALLGPGVQRTIRSPLDIAANAAGPVLWRASLARPDRRTFYVGGLDYLRRGAEGLPWIRLPDSGAEIDEPPFAAREGRIELRPPCAVVVRLRAEFPPGSTLRVAGRGVFRGACVAAWLPPAYADPDLSDPTEVFESLRHMTGPPELPAPHPEGGRFTLGLPLEAPEGAAALLFVFAPSEPIALEEISVRTVPRWRLALLDADADRGGAIRMVARGPDHRECLLLQAPGRAFFRLEDAPEAPRLRFAAACLQGEEGGLLRVGWRNRDSFRALADLRLPSASAGGDRFVEHDISLPKAVRAGGTLEFEWTGGNGAVVAVAHPEIAPALRPEDAPPDIVLVSLDTVRADRVAGFGGRAETTPTIASLLDRGIRFRTAIAPSSWTLPSHVSLFTGWTVPHHGVDAPERRLSARGPATLAETLRAMGYRTIAFTAGGFVHADFGLARGFDRYVCRELVEVKVEGGSARRVSDPLARELLAIASGERTAPTFLFVHTYAAHEYHPEDEDLEQIGAPPEARALRGRFQPWAAERLLERLENEPERTRFREGVRALYDASVHLADRFLGEIVQALSSSPSGGDTWIVVTSDHGEELFEFGRVGHNRSLSEPLLRIPLLLVPPQRLRSDFPPRAVDDVLSLCDLAPTLVDLARGGGSEEDRTPGAADGRSLFPLLTGRSLPPRPALAAIRGLAALRGARFKWIEGRDAEGRAVRRLVDLKEDPSEARDVSALRPELARRMERTLERLLATEGNAASDGSLSAERERELRALGYLGDD